MKFPSVCDGCKGVELCSDSVFRGPIKGAIAKVRLSTLLIGGCFSPRSSQIKKEKKKKTNKATSWSRHGVAVDNCHISEVPELCRLWQVCVGMTARYFHFLTPPHLLQPPTNKKISHNERS